MSNMVLNILSLGIKPLYERNMRFHTLISEFRNKLLSPQNQAKLTNADIEKFYNKVNSFDFRFIFFPKYYRKYIDNLNHLKPATEDKKPDLTLLEVALAENKWKPTTPFSILIHHLRYDFRFTSKIFVARQKKQNLKKLNTPGAKAQLKNKPKSSKEWTRVPMPRNQDNK